ncbi:MAG: undecaprenyl-diphosphate phosphatase [Spirulinaceae cyanobacterium]
MNSKKQKWFKFASTAILALLSLLILESLFASQSLSISEASTQTASQINIFQAVVLGMVQGLTEFLPISSTAHLKVVPIFLGWGDPGVAYTAIIQLGSIAAVVYYFWEDLTQVTLGTWQAIRKSDYQSQDFRIALGIAIGTIPIVILGLAMKAFIPDLDNSPLRSMSAIAIASIVMGLLLGVAERLGARQRDFDNLTTKDGILMGLAQALALIPGVSRSGSTITAGLFLGLERATAARFSFLLGIPAITLAGLVELKDLLSEEVTNSELLPLIVGLISAAIFSYLAIFGLIRYLQQQDTWVFVWYRLGFGLIILLGVTLGWFTG